MKHSTSSHAESLGLPGQNSNLQHLQTCEEHAGQTFTNFCSSMRCLKPLCPQCIDQHYDYHKKMNIKPQVDSFKTLRNKCMKKVLDILESISQRGTEIQINDDDSILEYILKVIEEVKEKCLFIMTTFFKQLQQQAIHKMKNNRQSKATIFKQFGKINKIIKQLKLLSSKLDACESHEFSYYAKSIVKLDKSKIIESVRQSYSYANQMAEFQRNNLYLMKNYDQKLLKLLNNIISYGKKEHVDRLTDQSSKKTIGQKHSQRQANSHQQMELNIQQTKSAHNQRALQKSNSSLIEIKSNDQTSLQPKIKNLYQTLKGQMGPRMTGSAYQPSNSQWKDANYHSPKTIKNRFDIEQTEHKHPKKIKSQLPSVNEETVQRKQIQNKTTYQKQPSKDIRKINGIEGKRINRKDYFNDNCNMKYLHFFPNDQSVGYFFNVEKISPLIRVEVKSKVRVPEFHRSITLPNGTIYIIGGTLHKSSEKSDLVMIYNSQQSTFEIVGKLLCSRSSHSLCLSGNGKYIYVLGGINNAGNITGSCERFDIEKAVSEEIKPLNFPVCSFASCAFNERYICKFGGVAEDSTLTHAIEIFDQKYSSWREIQPHLPMNIIKLLKVSTSTAVQINNSEIMIMGGYNDKCQGQKTTYFLRIEPPNKCEIIDINTYPLPFGQGFWSTAPIIHNSRVFVLQNIANESDNNQCIENYRKVMTFDGCSWQVLN